MRSDLEASQYLVHPMTDGYVVNNHGDRVRPLTGVTGPLPSGRTPWLIMYPVILGEANESRQGFSMYFPILNEELKYLKLKNPRILKITG